MATEPRTSAAGPGRAPGGGVPPGLPVTPVSVAVGPAPGFWRRDAAHEVDPPTPFTRAVRGLQVGGVPDAYRESGLLIDRMDMFRG